MGVAEELQRLADLHAAGQLDDEEYAQAKRAAMLEVARPTPAAAVPVAVEPEAPPAKKGLTRPKLIYAVVFTAFLFSFAGAGVSHGIEKLATPVVCRAPYDDHSTIRSYSEGAGYAEGDHLFCLSASGKQHEAPIILVLLTVFVIALVALTVLALLLLVPYRLLGGQLAA